MSTFIRALLTTVLLFLSCEHVLAKEWRGIIPLRSTRSDVIRLLNRCSDHREACQFRLNEADVYILFSGGLGDEFGECVKRLPQETVMFIQVEPRTKLKLSDLRIDKKQLRRFGRSEYLYPSVKNYLTTDGLVIETYKGRVNQLNYIAHPDDRLLCPTYYERPDIFIQTTIVHPPMVLSVECPEKVDAGAMLVLKANANPNLRRGPTWTISGGKIVSGQHTYKLIVDTTGLSSEEIKVDVELSDSAGHVVGTSCRVPVVFSR